MGKAAAHVLVRQRHGNSRVDLAQQIQNAIYSRKGGGMPRQAWSKKRERQYLHVKQGLVNRDDSADEAEEIAVVEIAKAMDFIDRRGRVADPGHDLGRQLEAQIHALGANVEEEIAGRGNRMARAGLDLAKGVQLRRPRSAKETIPRVRPNSHDAREI